MRVLRVPEPRRTPPNSRQGLSTAAQPRSDHPPPVGVTAQRLRDRVGPGEPIPGPLRASLEAEVGWDLSRVRVHSDPRGDHVARALGAHAVAFGWDIAVRRVRHQPHTSAGRALLRHEAVHIAETAGGPSVNLATDVDDISAEMVGLTFTLRTARGDIPKGAHVVVVDWRGTTPVARVRGNGPKGEETLDVPKLELEPLYTPVARVRKYRVGLTAQQRAVAASEQQVRARAGEAATIRSRESSFRKRHDVWERNLEKTEKELANQEQLLARRQATFSRMLIRETMYNRFDADIAHWVDHYNTLLQPKENCNPDLVKSMIFRETRMGTHGNHLELPPYSWSDRYKNPIRSRFNLMQAVDSPGEQQLLMIKEMAPDLYTKHELDEFVRSHRASGLTESVIWGNPEFTTALHDFFARRAAGNNAMGRRDVDLHLDYAFWIRTGVRWLFYKYKAIGEASWAEAARAYNGAGKGAQEYKKDVISRVGGVGALDVGDQ